MNDLFAQLGVESWKAVIGALVLPPVPLLLLVLVGARLMFRRRLLAWFLILLAVLGLWFSCTQALGHALTQWLLKPPRALAAGDIAELKRAPKTAIVVLGGGRQLLAPEYGISNLKPRTVDRLRYGVWLAKETGLPLGFSGGVGHHAGNGATEAEIATRISEREFGVRLRYTENESRDTRENGARTVALLKPAGIETIVLVTHDYHMRRSVRSFETAVAANGGGIRVVAAPMGLPMGGPPTLLDWFPSTEGFERVRVACHEWLGLLMGA
jgi:uncharacterized SAM-binding protein YcdF (DUF218 family)